MKEYTGKRVVVFGATGGVGAYLSLYLADKGYQVLAVGRRDNDNGFFIENGIQYYSADITEQSRLLSLPTDDIYAIIHLAGCLPASMKVYNPQDYIDHNVSGTIKVLEYAVKCKVKRFVFPTTQSDVSYLWGSLNPIPADAERRYPENTDHSVYAISKNAAVSLVQHYSTVANFKSFIIRFANIFLWHPNPYYYVDCIKTKKGLYSIIEEAIKGEDIELWGDPRRVRDIFYVKDCIRMMERCLSSNSKGGIFNVGTGKAISRLEQVQGIIDVFCSKEKKSTIIHCPEKPDSPQIIFDISMNTPELGFEPMYDYLSFLKDFKREMVLNRFEKLWGRPEDYK